MQPFFCRTRRPAVFQWTRLLSTGLFRHVIYEIQHFSRLAVSLDPLGFCAITWQHCFRGVLYSPLLAKALSSCSSACAFCIFKVAHCRGQTDSQRTLCTHFFFGCFATCTGDKFKQNTLQRSPACLNLCADIHLCFIILVELSKEAEILSRFHNNFLWDASRKFSKKEKKCLVCIQVCEWKYEVLNTIPPMFWQEKSCRSLRCPKRTRTWLGSWWGTRWGTAKSSEPKGPQPRSPPSPTWFSAASQAPPAQKWIDPVRQREMWVLLINKVIK